MSNFRLSFDIENDSRTPCRFVIKYGYWYGIVVSPKVPISPEAAQLEFERPSLSGSIFVWRSISKIVTKSLSVAVYESATYTTCVRCGISVQNTDTLP